MDEANGVEITDVTVRLAGRTVLDRFSMSLRPGAKALLTGPSGSGKSTVLRCLLGFVTPEAGSVRIQGQAMTAETVGMIGEEEFKIMKETAYIINIARGPIIQEKAMIKALQEHWIAGAGLDVFEKEPLPEDSPLWDMKNVVITPHYAGATPKYFDRLVEIFTENLGRYQAGEPMINIVDKKLGY